MHRCTEALLASCGGDTIVEAPVDHDNGSAPWRNEAPVDHDDPYSWNFWQRVLPKHVIEDDESNDLLYKSRKRFCLRRADATWI